MKMSLNKPPPRRAEEALLDSTYPTAAEGDAIVAMATTAAPGAHIWYAPLPEGWGGRVPPQIYYVRLPCIYHI